MAQQPQLDMDALVAAMNRADASYVVDDAGTQPKCYDSRVFVTHRSSLDAFWGIYEGKGLRIGVRGKVQALYGVLCATVRVDSIEQLAADTVALAKNARQHDHPELFEAYHELARLGEWPEKRKQGGRGRYNRLNPRGQLKTLIATTTQRDIPPSDAAPHLLTLAERYVASRLSPSMPERDVAGIVRAAMANNYSRPSDCAMGLVSALGLGKVAPRKRSARGGKVQRQRLAELSYIEPALNSYVMRSRAGTHDDTTLHLPIEEVLVRLSGASPNRSNHGTLVVLGGGSHVGKKAVVGDVLVELHRRSDDFVFTGMDGVSMPIFATNARRQDYLMLALQVLVFLEGYRDAQNAKLVPFDVRLAKKRDLMEVNSATFTLENLLEQIGQLSDQPALFIFTDVEGSRADSVLKVLRNYGINRLLLTLLKNAFSRVLVTDSHATKGQTNLAYAAAGPQGKPIMVPEPTIERLRWYMPHRTVELKAVFRRLTPTELEHQVSGRTLILLSLLLQDVITDADTAVAVVRKCFPDWKGYPSVDPAEELVRLFLSRCVTDGLLEAIALICASEDGVTDRTLRRSLERWPGYGEDGENISSGSVNHVLHKLKALADASPLLLRRDDIFYLDPEEYSFDEEGQHSNWECSADIAHVVRSVMASDDGWAKIGRLAHRQISIAARRRAQIKKMRSSTMLGLVRNAEARDVQSYVAMLASIDPSDVQHAAEVASRSLRLSGDHVFTPGIAFDSRIALRFAVQCQLKEDIDRDFRLTMVSDQDELRLRLYLLPFCELGVRHEWSIDDMRSSPSLRAFGLTNKMPQHVRNAFSPSEIMELLITIALAGFHCQFPAVIGWAYTHALRIGVKEKTRLNLATWKNQIVRMRCAIIDLRIQRGKSLRSALRTVERWLTPAALGSEPTTLLADIAQERGLEQLKSWMRLRAREAELRWILNCDDQTVWPIYHSLYDIEHHLAERIDQDDPVVLSGRTARRYIRSLCGDAPIYRTAPPEIAEEESVLLIRRMLEINISRLRRFGGADRIGVLVDMARRHHLEGNDAKALQYAITARERVLAGSISHGGKIDVISVHVALRLRSAETLIGMNDFEGAKGHLDEAAHDCTLLANLADAVEFAPSKAVAFYLKARLYFAQSETVMDDKERSRALLNSADRAMRAAIDTTLGFLNERFGSATVAEESAIRRMRGLERSISHAIEDLLASGGTK